MKIRIKTALLLALSLPAAAQVKTGAGAGQEFTGVKVPVFKPLTQPSAPATLRVKESVVLAAASTKLFGISYNWDLLGPRLFTEGRRADFVQKFQDFPLYFNRIGGADGQRFHWKNALGPADQRPAQSMYEGRPPYVAKMGPVEWVQLVREIQPQAAVVFALNFIDETPQDHADLAEFLGGDGKTNPNGGENWAAKRIAAGLKEPVKVALWELGNENDWDKKEAIQPEEYIKRCQATIAAIRRVDPTAKFAAHAATSPGGANRKRVFEGDWSIWHLKVLKALGPDISHLVVHPYYKEPGQALRILESIRRDIKTVTGKNDIGIFLSEHAAWPPNIGQPERYFRTHALEGCLLVANLLVEQMQYENTAACYWTMSGVPWGVFYPKGEKEIYTTGIFDLLKLLGGNLGETVVQSTFSGERTTLGEEFLSANSAVMKSKDGLVLYLVNYEPTAARELSLSFEGKYALQEETVLTGESFDSHNSATAKDIKVNTQRFPGDKVISKYSLPAKSVVVLKLKKLG
ncbi:hypothetical protein [Hymenobacter sp.]|uniref:hypothetical protein n=1 Tax=Hymenobacter sp. TaxID=1898978 RepID=UPI00286C824F|nr:hypothetical protein [Hymenobacter sp.]